jgi:phosphomannomutase/phosphoglucomutase
MAPRGRRTESRAGIPIPASIFRAYDIRGIVEEQLTEDSVKQISRGIGSESLAHGIDTLLVGFDGRLSSPSLSRALTAGLLSTGCKVVNLGMVPTPLLYYACHTSGIESGVMLTASHNPANYNGLKVVFKQTCLAANQIQKIRLRVEQDQLRDGAGSYSELNIQSQYIEAIRSSVSLGRKLKLVVDCGNAVPGLVAPELFRALDCEVEPLFCDIDGNFPNHHPDPTVADNLASLSQRVVASQADLGIAFDGDGDRLGIVTNLGEAVDADKILMLLVKHIAPKYPAAPIIYDVKCSSNLARVITAMGATPVMHRSGHSFMKQKMQETGAPLGGEFAAHIFIKDRWFGFDDGLYAAARVLEILSHLPHAAHEEFASFPSSVNTPEIKLPVPEAARFELMQRIIDKADFPGAKLVLLDGLRVEYSDGWGLVRASNTSAALLLRFEADTLPRLQAIQTSFKALIHSADKSLELNF